MTWCHQRIHWLLLSLHSATAGVLLMIAVSVGPRRTCETHHVGWPQWRTWCRYVMWPLYPLWPCCICFTGFSTIPIIPPSRGRCWIKRKHYDYITRNTTQHNNDKQLDKYKDWQAFVNQETVSKYFTSIFDKTSCGDLLVASSAKGLPETRPTFGRDISICLVVLAISSASRFLGACFNTMWSL